MRAMPTCSKMPPQICERPTAVYVVVTPQTEFHEEQEDLSAWCERMLG